MDPHFDAWMHLSVYDEKHAQRMVGWVRRVIGSGAITHADLRDQPRLLNKVIQLHTSPDSAVHVGSADTARLMVTALMWYLRFLAQPLHRHRAWYSGTRLDRHAAELSIRAQHSHLSTFTMGVLDPGFYVRQHNELVAALRRRQRAIEGRMLRYYAFRNLAESAASLELFGTTELGPWIQLSLMLLNLPRSHRAIAEMKIPAYDPPSAQDLDARVWDFLDARHGSKQRLALRCHYTAVNDKPLAAAWPVRTNISPKDNRLADGAIPQTRLASMPLDAATGFYLHFYATNCRGPGLGDVLFGGDRNGVRSQLSVDMERYARALGLDPRAYALHDTSRTLAEAQCRSMAVMAVRLREEHGALDLGRLAAWASILEVSMANTTSHYTALSELRASAVAIDRWAATMGVELTPLGDPQDRRSSLASFDGLDPALHALLQREIDARFVPPRGDVAVTRTEASLHADEEYSEELRAAERAWFKVPLGATVFSARQRRYGQTTNRSNARDLERDYAWQLVQASGLVDEGQISELLRTRGRDLDEARLIQRIVNQIDKPARRRRAAGVDEALLRVATTHYHTIARRRKPQVQLWLSTALARALTDPTTVEYVMQRLAK